MFKHPILKTAVAATLLGAAGVTAQAQDAGALVDALVKKGVLTDQEAEDVRAQMMRDFATTPAGKINLGSSITELKLYGDLRLRYQYDNKDPQLFVPNRPDNQTPTGSQRSRWRFRLRLNADFRLTENFSGGVELQTAQASDSGNQTYENGFDDYNIFISKAYLRWDPTDWLAVSAGKFANPFYTTDLVWDSDMNPTGIAESIALHKLFGLGGEETVEGYSKDGKATATTVASESPWEISLVAGQFIFDDNLEGSGTLGTSNFAVDNDSTTDAYLFQTQLVTSYKFDGGTKFTVAPGWMTFVNGSLTGLSNENSFNDRDGAPIVSGASRNLNILLMPGDVSFKIGSLKTKFYWDFAYNIEGRKRAENIYQLFTFNNNAGQSSDDDVTDPDDKTYSHSAQDDYAYLVGLQFGENKKKGDLSMLANWRQTGIASVDPNLNDSDFALGELNTRGFKFGLSYNLTDFAVGTVTYMYAWNLRDDLVGGQATGGNAIADGNNIQVLQVDLSVKF